MTLMEGVGPSSSPSIRRKPRTFKTNTVVKAKLDLRLKAELHPPLRAGVGTSHTVEICLGTEGIVCGPDPNGSEGHHVVAFDYGRHHTATAVVSSEYISRL